MKTNKPHDTATERRIDIPATEPVHENPLSSASQPTYPTLLDRILSRLRGSGQTIQLSIGGNVLDKIIEEHLLELGAVKRKKTNAPKESKCPESV